MTRGGSRVGPSPGTGPLIYVRYCLIMLCWSHCAHCAALRATFLLRNRAALRAALSVMYPPRGWWTILVKKIAHENQRCCGVKEVPGIPEQVLFKSYLLVRASNGRFCVFLYVDLGHFHVIFCTFRRIFFKLLKSE